MVRSRRLIAGHLPRMVCAVLLGAALASGCSDPPHPLQGEPAPDLKLPLLDGGELDLATHEGQDVVLLDFFATWCPPCRQVLPSVAELAKEYEGQPVAVYAVNLRESAEDVRDFLEGKEIAIQVALDTAGLTSSSFEISSIPQTVVIGKDGVIKHVHVGWSVGLKGELSSHIDAALEEENVL